MKMNAWRMRVADALGVPRHTVGMSSSRVRNSGLRFERKVHDTGRCVFEARPDGPRIRWGDCVTIEASYDLETWRPVYYGEARRVGPEGSVVPHTYEFASLRQRLFETEMPQISLPSMEVSAMLGIVIDMVKAQWGDAIKFTGFPVLNINGPRLTATNYQVVGAFMDEITGFVNRARGDDLAPVEWGVDATGTLRWGVPQEPVLDLDSYPVKSDVEWQDVICERPVTRVRWFLKPIPGLGFYTAMTDHPQAAVIGPRVHRQTLTSVDVWSDVNFDYDNAPHTTWGPVSPADRRKLGEGTAAIPLTFDPATGRLPAGQDFQVTPAHPWAFLRVAGNVGTDSWLDIVVEKYDTSTAENPQPQRVTGEFDVTIPARTNLALGNSGVRVILKAGGKEGVVPTVTLRRVAFMMPDMDALELLAGSFYNVPRQLVGTVRFPYLLEEQAGMARITGPDGLPQVLSATYEHIISGGRDGFGHTIVKLGDPEPSNRRAARELLDLRTNLATADVVAART